MSLRKKAEKVRDEFEKISKESEWDIPAFRVMYGNGKCIRCGSTRFKDILIYEAGVTYCCSDCPELDEYH